MAGSDRTGNPSDLIAKQHVVKRGGKVVEVVLEDIKQPESKCGDDDDPRSPEIFEQASGYSRGHSAGCGSRLKRGPLLICHWIHNMTVQTSGPKGFPNELSSSNSILWHHRQCSAIRPIN